MTGVGSARAAAFRVAFWIVAFLVVTVRSASADTSILPTHGQAEAIGSANDGCLEGGVGLPLEGPGYQVSRPERRRYFGHPALVDFIQALARRAQAAGLPLLYVGDMAEPRGGPMPQSSHKSHQTGLDADLWFTFGPHYAPDLAPHALPDPRSMLRDGKGEIDAGAFGQDQMTLLRFALADPRVDRILINPAIKLALCRGVAGAVYFGRDWLRRLQPWPGHDDHFHVRLSCPESSPSCVPSDDLAEGDGCDAVSLTAASPPRRDSHAAKAALMATACPRVLGR